MIISNEMDQLIKDQEGWTRRMFEEGIRIKKLYGLDAVCDFSLGNPDTEPPETLRKALIDMLSSPEVGTHRYMSNNGYEDVRENIAEYLREVHGVPFTAGHIFMTVGCAGGLNVILKSMLNKGDEVIVPTPFFWEFKNYINNFGGVTRFVETKEDFQLDIGNIEAAITKKTKAILINSPNNPTGAVYQEKSMKQLASLLNAKREQGQDIYIITDDAYKKLIYDGLQIPNIFKMYDLVLSVTSHSKDLALAGERIGYVTISPNIKDMDLLVSAMTISIRVLGFVNAPALFQTCRRKISEDFSQYWRITRRREIPSMRYSWRQALSV